MSSISDKLNKLIQIKSDIKDAIVDKGVEMPAGLPFDQYASKVSEISGGGGEAPNREDINLYTSGTINIGIDKEGIMVEPTSTYTCAIANEYNDSTATIPLSKTLDHYEINLRLQPFYISQTNFGVICWRGLNECGFTTDVNYIYTSTRKMRAKYTYNSETGDTLYFKSTDPVSIKYTFNSNNSTTVTFKTDDSNSVTTTYTAGTPTTMTSVGAMYIFGDSGDSSQAYNRRGIGKLYYEGTYIRDLDTNEIVWELCDGYNK